MNKVARRHMINLTSKVNEFRANDAYCDVEIHVEESVFKCHRLILAAASEYFHSMFGAGKFKESSSFEVTLEDVVQPQIFGQILRFFYTGEISINDTNLCKLFRASDFFELPYMRELCLRYVQQNMDVLLEDGLEMFLFTRATGKAAFAEIIGRYVCKHLDYFSKTREFLELSFEDFIALLNQIPDDDPASTTKSQDVYMNAIMQWIRHTDRSPRDIKLHFDELINRINFVRLSSDCIKDSFRMNINGLIALRENGASNDEILPQFNATDPKNFHVYLNTFSDDEDKSTFVTSIFSLRDRPGEKFDRWVNSYQFDSTDSYNFMRTIVMDGSLYCLSTSTAPHQSTEVSQMLFRKSSSIFLCSNSYLKPPPLILDHYDMCGHGKHIYVYNRNPLSATIISSCPSDDNTSFDREQLSRGIYLYDRGVDIWLPLPPLKCKFANACLTCDEQMLYLVGGTNSNKYVQGYDHRTSEWIKLSSTKHVFEQAACCAHRKKVYVSGGCHTNSMEMYDPKAGKWQRMGRMMYDRSNHRIDTFLHSDNFLVTAGENSDVELYNVAENEWKFMTSLHQSVMNSDLKFKHKLKIVDMVTYNFINFDKWQIAKG